MATFEETLELAVKCAVERAKEAATEIATEISNNTTVKVVNNFYPVGAYFITEADTDPSELFGGTWVKKGQGRCLWGADDTNKAGTTIAAGLPDITGTFPACVEDQYLPSPTGAFSYKGQTYEADGLGRKGNWLLNFAASGSNSIYGRSTTVQPPALAVNIWVRTA